MEVDYRMSSAGAYAENPYANETHVCVGYHPWANTTCHWVLRNATIFWIGDRQVSQAAFEEHVLARAEAIQDMTNGAIQLVSGLIILWLSFIFLPVYFITLIENVYYRQRLGSFFGQLYRRSIDLTISVLFFSVLFNSYATS